MSLNTINLAPATLLAFYKRSLVEIGEALPARAEPVSTETAPLQYLGKNEKHIVILVHYADQVYLPEEQLNFLTSVLKACQLNIGDIAIVNSAKQPADTASLTASLTPRQIIIFGDPNGEHFRIREIAGVSMLSAPELEMLNQNNETGKVLKGKLWSCLKQLFNV